MLKLLVFGVLLTGCVVFAQHGSFTATNRPTCVELSNHCVVDADCCTKACNSSTQKCIININPVNSTTTNTVPNRFGEDGQCRAVGNDCRQGRDCCSGECLVSSKKCINSKNSDSSSDESNSNELQGQPETTTTGIPCQKKSEQCSTSRGCCAFLSCEKDVCRDNAVLIMGTETLGYQPGNNLTNRFGEGENVTNQTQASVAPTNTKCAEIGSKCYKLSDCCQGLKCHGFLHQCVS